MNQLLDDAGYCIEGPGDLSDGELAGRHWWTLSRNGWGGVECGPDFATATEATDDALAALLADEDLDWVRCAVRPHATAQFPADFAKRMRQVRGAASATS